MSFQPVVHFLILVTCHRCRCSQFADAVYDCSCFYRRFSDVSADAQWSYWGAPVWGFSSSSGVMWRFYVSGDTWRVLARQHRDKWYRAVVISSWPVPCLTGVRDAQSSTQQSPAVIGAVLQPGGNQFSSDLRVLHDKDAAGRSINSIYFDLQHSWFNPKDISLKLI